MSDKKRHIFLENITVINRQLMLDNVEGGIATFEHIVSLGGNVDFLHKKIVPRIDIQVKNVATGKILAIIVVDFVYDVSDFDDFLNPHEHTKVEVDEILQYISQESISTVRGIMYDTFRGTVLQNAYLPLITRNNFTVPLLINEPFSKIKSKK